MRFMTLLKAKENGAAGAPSQELFEAIGKLGQEAIQAGVLVDTGGLAPVEVGARVDLSDTRLTVSDGASTDAKQTILSYAVYDVPSQDQAVEWVSRFMQAHRDHWTGWEGEAEIRQVFGPNDPPPAG